MYKIILTHISAIKYYRESRIDSENIQILHLVNNLIVSKKKYGTQSVEIMVRSKRAVHNNWRYKYRVCSASLPKKSLNQITENVYCVSPELLLVLLSTLLPYAKLALIALEMCGTYSINTNSNKFVGDLKPITSPNKIIKFIDNYEKLNPRFKGIRKLKDILKFIKGGSASPIESRLFIKLCGSRKEGFYDCRGLTMNEPIRLSYEAAKIAGQAIVIPDILSKKLKVAIEYNSSQFHESNEQGQKDRRRRDALVYDGWKVISITPQQLYNKETFHIIAIQILKALGQNYRFESSRFFHKRNKSLEVLR